MLDLANLDNSKDKYLLEISAGLTMSLYYLSSYILYDDHKISSLPQSKFMTTFDINMFLTILEDKLTKTGAVKRPENIFCKAKITNNVRGEKTKMILPSGIETEVCFDELINHAYSSFVTRCYDYDNPKHNTNINQFLGFINDDREKQLAVINSHLDNSLKRYSIIRKWTDEKLDLHYINPSQHIIYNNSIYVLNEDNLFNDNTKNQETFDSISTLIVNLYKFKYKVDIDLDKLQNSLKLATVEYHDLLNRYINYDKINSKQNDKMKENYKKYKGASNESSF